MRKKDTLGKLTPSNSTSFHRPIVPLSSRPKLSPLPCPALPKPLPARLPVPGAARQLCQGQYVWPANKPEGPRYARVWRLALPYYSCANEDALRNGILMPDTTAQRSWRVRPGHTTEPYRQRPERCTGHGNRHRQLSAQRCYNDAIWVQFVLGVGGTLRGTLGGTEASATVQYRLASLPSDSAGAACGRQGAPAPAAAALATALIERCRGNVAARKQQGSDKEAAT